MNNGRFEGWYLKHQRGGRTLALIPGRSAEAAFVQVVTDERAYHVVYALRDYDRQSDRLLIGENRFACDGITLNLHGSGIALTGSLRYGAFTPIRSDIMGPFRFFPMECRHSVVSMSHGLSGCLTLNGEAWDFDGGRGYAEGDSGRSFPQQYAWVHCNDFTEDCSIMASVALIPFAGRHFWGCICVVWHEGREYRLATYRGARIRCLSENRLELTQGRYRLVVQVSQGKKHGLFAPQKGEMQRVIHERPSCTAYFRFLEGDTVVFQGESQHAGFEFVE